MLKRILGILELVWILIFGYLTLVFPAIQNVLWVIIFLTPIIVFHAILLIREKN
jgi:hypothetical protein